MPAAVWLRRMSRPVVLLQLLPLCRNHRLPARPRPQCDIRRLARSYAKIHPADSGTPGWSGRGSGACFGHGGPDSGSVHMLLRAPSAQSESSSRRAGGAGTSVRFWLLACPVEVGTRHGRPLRRAAQQTGTKPLPGASLILISGGGLTADSLPMRALAGGAGNGAGPNSRCNRIVISYATVPLLSPSVSR